MAVQSDIILIKWGEGAWLLFSARKRSLGQGNFFTHVCHSVHWGVGFPACITGQMTRGVCIQGVLHQGGSASRGVCKPGGICIQGFCIGGSASRGIGQTPKHYGIRSISGGSASRGFYIRGGLHPGGSANQGESASRGSASGGLHPGGLGRPPSTMGYGQ